MLSCGRLSIVKYCFLEESKRLRDDIRSLASTSLAHFINDGSMYVFVMLYPILVNNYSISLLEVGVLAALQSAFSISVSPFIGRWSDAKRNYGTLIAEGMLFLGFGIGGFAFATLYFSGYSLFLSLIPFSAITGIGSAFYHPLGATVLSEKWRGKNLGRAMGINGSIGSVGRAIYPVIVVALVVSLTVPSIFTLSIAAFATGLIVFLMLRSTTSMKSISGKDLGKEAESSIPISALMPSLLALTIVAFIRGIFTIGIVSLIPTYLTKVGKISYGFDLGIIVVIMNATAIFSQPFFGWLADKIGRRLALGISNLGSVIAMLLFLTTSNSELLVVYLAMFGLFTLTAFPLIMSLTSEIVPRRASTMANSIVWGVGNVGGGAVGPVLIGLLAEPTMLNSLNSSFYVVTLIGIVSVVLMPLVPKPKERGEEMRGMH